LFGYFLNILIFLVKKSVWVDGKRGGFLGELRQWVK